MPPRPSRSRPLVPLLLGALVMLVVVGAGALYMARKARGPVIVVAPPPPPAETTPAPHAGVASAIPPALSGRASASRVTFHVTPKNALMLVDGVLMPAGVDAVDRPATGARRVMFRAEKFEDYVEVVDTSTPAVLDIALLPRGASVRRPVVRRPARPTTAPSSSALPNPYDE